MNWSSSYPTAVFADCSHSLQHRLTHKPLAVDSLLSGTRSLDLSGFPVLCFGSPPHQNRPMVLSIASDLKTRQIVWVRNGVKIHSAPAAIWSAIGRHGRLWCAAKASLLISSRHTYTSRRDTHIHITHIHIMKHTSSFKITYQVPYPAYGLNEEWRFETFNTLKEAKDRIQFYQSCGSPAKLINWKN